jgi:hypothetical protein
MRAETPAHLWDALEAAKKSQDHVRVWAMLQHDVPALIPVLESMLKEYGPPNT